MTAPESIRAAPLVSSLRSLRSLEADCRHEHSYIEPADECWFLSVYHAGNCANELNRLIFSWKYAPSMAALNPEIKRQKADAIDTVASILRRCCDRRWVETATWCPIPPSAGVGSTDYDDRLWRTLCAAFQGYDLDARLLLRQTATTRADHLTARRSSSAYLHGLLRVDADTLRERPLRQRVVLFDDLLTSGKHFKCCQRRLREVVAKLPVCGVFFARRVQSSRWCRVGNFARGQS